MTHLEFSTGACQTPTGQEMVISHLCAMYRNSKIIFCFVYENIKRVGNFSKVAEFFSTAPPDGLASNVSYTCSTTLTTTPGTRTIINVGVLV